MRSDCGTVHRAFFRYALNARSLGKTYGGRYERPRTLASLSGTAADIVPGISVGERDATLIPVQGISSSSSSSSRRDVAFA